jgi:hypothetical protein
MTPVVTRPRAERGLDGLRVLLVVLLVAACAVDARAPSVPPWNHKGDPVVLAAGDIVHCGRDEHLETLAIAERHPEATIATLGDTVYEKGSAKEFRDCYDPTWGRLKERTRPAVGGHEYLTPGARGYFDYFGELLEPFGEDATSPRRGWYSYGIGDWHVVVLNSRCEYVKGGCTHGSPQLTWLAEDLMAAAADSKDPACTLAYWHTPRFSSGRKGNSPEMKPFWDVLMQYGAEVVLNGDNHTYERFGPQDAFGQLNDAEGIREFVVGTGGRGLYSFADGPLQPNSEARNDAAFGLLKLTLHTGGYDWEFLPVAGEDYTDSGSAACH